MSDFYLNLPSTVQGRGNVNSDYTTRLPEPLQFKGSKWSVGLCEVLISGEIRTVPRHTPFVITLKDGSIVNCILPRGTYTTPQSLVNALNNAVPGLQKRRFRRSVQTVPGGRNINNNRTEDEEEEDEEEEEELHISKEERLRIQAEYLKLYGTELKPISTGKSTETEPQTDINGSKKVDSTVTTTTVTPAPKLTPAATPTTPATTVAAAPKVPPKPVVASAPHGDSATTVAQSSAGSALPPNPDAQLDALKREAAEKKKKDDLEKLKLKKKHEEKAKAEKEAAEALAREERRRKKEELEAIRLKELAEAEERRRKELEKAEKKAKEEAEQRQKEADALAAQEKLQREEKERNDRLSSALAENTLEPVVTVNGLVGNFTPGQPLSEHVIFEYDEIAGRILVDLRHTVAKLEMHKEIAYMTGFGVETLHDSAVADFSPDCTNGKGLIFIYSDCASFSVTGTQRTNLLRIIPCLNAQNGTISQSFAQVRYVGVRSDFIDSIRIQILDSLGNEVAIDGYVTVVLHMRKE